jgi:hypothetical protein
MTWFPGNVVQRWVDDNNNVIATLDSSGNLVLTGNATVAGNVAVTGNVTAADNAVDALTAAGAISVTTPYTTLVGPAASTYAVTLAAPSVDGLVKVIRMLSTTDTNAVTLALTNVSGGSADTSASFDAAGETLVLVSAGTKWVVLKELGVTLS